MKSSTKILISFISTAIGLTGAGIGMAFLLASEHRPKVVPIADTEPKADYVRMMVNGQSTWVESEKSIEVTRLKNEQRRTREVIDLAFRSGYSAGVAGRPLETELAELMTAIAALQTRHLSEEKGRP